jgi:hypothetical protein
LGNAIASAVCHKEMIMPSARPLVPAFSPPSPDEAAALALTATYLSRAATEMATRLLPDGSFPQMDLLATLRDNLNGSAALCECLLAVFDEWPKVPGAQPPRGYPAGYK